MEVSVKQRSETHTVDSKLQSYGHRLRGDSREQRIRNAFEHRSMDQATSLVTQPVFDVSGPTPARGNMLFPAGVQ